MPDTRAELPVCCVSRLVLLCGRRSRETLVDEAVELRRRAEASGVDVHLELFPDMPHVFQMFIASPCTARSVQTIGLHAQRYSSDVTRPAETAPLPGDARARM